MKIVILIAYGLTCIKCINGAVKEVDNKESTTSKKIAAFLVTLLYCCSYAYLVDLLITFK